MNPKIDTAQAIERPDAFARGALELSYQLLRTRYPALALSVRNLLVAPTASSVLPTDSRYINIELDPTTIGKIVAALTAMGMDALDGPETDAGTRIALRSLIEDWAGLAEWLLNQAQGDNTLIH